MDHLFNSTVDIVRPTRTSDSMGGATETTPVLYNNLPCRINWTRGNEKIQFGKDTYYRDAKLYCNVISVLNSDRIVYGSKTYEIVNSFDVDNVGKYMVIEMRLIE